MFPRGPDDGLETAFGTYAITYPSLPSPYTDVGGPHVVNSWDSGRRCQSRMRRSNSRAAQPLTSEDASTMTTTAWRARFVISERDRCAMGNPHFVLVPRVAHRGHAQRARERAERGTGAPRATEPGFGAEPRLVGRSARGEGVGSADDTVASYPAAKRLTRGSNPGSARGVGIPHQHDTWSS